MRNPEENEHPHRFTHTMQGRIYCERCGIVVPDQQEGFSKSRYIEMRTDILAGCFEDTTS